MQIDDLKVNQWVMITGFKQFPQVEQPDHDFFMCGARPALPVPKRPDISGYPLMIIGISLPYMVALMGGEHFMRFDTRDFTWARCERAYVKQFLDRNHRKAEVATAKGDCACGGKARQRKSITNGEWEMVCGTCGLSLKTDLPT